MLLNRDTHHHHHHHHCMSVAQTFCGFEASHPIYIYIYQQRTAYIYFVYIYHTRRLVPFFPHLDKKITSFGGEDDPNIRELVERMQKYHDEVEQEFTGQKVRWTRGGMGWGGAGELSSARLSSHDEGTERGAVPVSNAKRGP